MPGPLVVVAGALANKPCNGGEAWVRMSWARGLQRLGCRVWFLEQIEERVCTDESGRASAFAGSLNRRWFESVVNRFGLGDTSMLVCDRRTRSSSRYEPAGEGGSPTAGASREDVRVVLSEADLLVNISGNLTDSHLLDVCNLRAYVDLDPGFTQLWHHRGDRGARLAGHHRYFTVGLGLGSTACRIPTGGLNWRPVCPPVVLEDWPVAEPLAPVGEGTFTTVATWRGPFGPVEWDRRRFGLKVHEFRKFIALPTLLDSRFEAALAIHPAEVPDLELLEENRWHLVDPRVVAGTPDRFRQYVAGSMAEFSVAQEMYVRSECGWFSDRTTRYLASGRPALVQDTGFSRHLPVGKGLVAFSTLDEARAGAVSITDDYPAHATAARALAEEHFDSDRVLTRFLEECDLP